MNASQPNTGRMRAYFEFLVAFVYFFVARSLAHNGALGLAREQWTLAQWTPLIDQAMLVFLLLLGYAGMGVALDHELHPLQAQGFPRRAGWQQETGLGVAFGWALAVACVLPLLVGGGIAIVLILGLSAWGWLVADAAFFALVALAEEIAFRGYGFQRFAHAVGPVGAAVGFAIFYAIVQSLLPGSIHVTFAVSLAFSLVLSTAYLRTHALWVSWGINFGWKASRALLFGLAIGGDNSHSPVVQGNPMGPFWLTGGGFGLDSSWVTLIFLLAALPVVFRLTREMNNRTNAPENVPGTVPGNLPVDLDAATPPPANPEPPSTNQPPTAN
jgi:membrane protease YdiL (CAAX protease family)